MGNTDNVNGLSPVVFPKETQQADQHRLALEALLLAMTSNFASACVAAKTMDGECRKTKKRIVWRVRHNFGTEDLRQQYREKRDPVQQCLGRMREFQLRLEAQLATTERLGIPELTDECRHALAALLTEVDTTFAKPMKKLPTVSETHFQRICDKWRAVCAKLLSAIQGGANILPACGEELTAFGTALDTAGAKVQSFVRT